MNTTLQQQDKTKCIENSVFISSSAKVDAITTASVSTVVSFGVT